MNISADSQDSNDQAALLQTWAAPPEDMTPTVQLPVTLSLNPVQRMLALIIVALSMAGAWGTLHYFATESSDALVGVALCLALLATGIGLSVASVSVDHNQYKAVGAWRIVTVPLSRVVKVRHHEDMVALVTDAGVVKFIGPLGDAGSHTLSHGLPEGATAAGLALAIERARRTAVGSPAPTLRHRVPPGYRWAGLAAAVLVVRVFTLFLL